MFESVLLPKSSRYPAGSKLEVVVVDNGNWKGLDRLGDKPIPEFEFQRREHLLEARNRESTRQIDEMMVRAARAGRARNPVMRAWYRAIFYWNYN